MHKIAVYSSQIIDAPQSSLHKHIILPHSNSFEPSTPSTSIQKFQGDIYLYKNIKQSSSMHKILKDKSRVIMFYNPPNIVVEELSQKLLEIQNYDIIAVNDMMEVEVGMEVGVGVGRETERKICYLVVFKSYALAEDFDKYLGLISQEFYYLYLEDCTIFSGEIEKKQDIQSIMEKQLQLGKQWIRLPICPNCLQLLQPQISGIIIPQNPHHLIINKACIVCSKRHNKQSNLTCEKCDQTKDIWICLICGAIGCGRYKNADAQKHYIQTNHTLSYDFESGRIWNYSSDCFSHKVVGKQAQLMMQQEQDIQTTQNSQNTFWKYCAIISEQLQEQQKYYKNIQDDQKYKFSVSLSELDEKIAQLSSIKLKKIGELKKKQKKNKQLDKKNKSLEEECEEERIFLAELEKSAKFQYEAPHSQILRKKKEIQEIQLQISQFLLKLQ